jgi:hypothetical protein
VGGGKFWVGYTSAEGITDMDAEKKRIEAYMLAAARKAGVPIPTDECPDEEPDFRFNDEVPALGIELSEVLRPASSNHGILPVEQETFHREIITKAQQNYYDAPDAKRVHVSVYFTNTRGEKRHKGQLAVALTEFVRANVHRANPFVSLYRPETPDGFDSVVISPESTACREDQRQRQVGTDLPRPFASRCACLALALQRSRRSAKHDDSARYRRMEIPVPVRQGFLVYGFRGTVRRDSQNRSHDRSRNMTP